MARDTTITDASGDVPGKPRKDFFALTMLGFVLVATASLLGIDIYDTYRAGAVAGPSRQTGPVVMRPPADGDQVRPYLERGRPVAPERVSLPGTRGPAPSETAPMSFTRDGKTLRAEGMITTGVVDAFERALQALPEDITPAQLDLVLHSPGGVVTEALALARMIRDAGMTTRVAADGYCASSCPIIFAAGTKRRASEKSWIGVHRVYVGSTLFGNVDDSIGEAQHLSAQVQDLLNGFGVDPLVWTHAMRTPKQNLYFFTPKELKDLKLATRIE